MRTISILNARTRVPRQRRPIPRWEKVFNSLGLVGFVALHLACLAVFFTGTTTVALVLCAGCYLLQMIGITIGYHRYLSHRAFKTSRPFQFVLAFLGCCALQKGPLWWAAGHRQHHRYADTSDDLHSPIVRSWWWAHIGWVLGDDL